MAVKQSVRRILFRAIVCLGGIIGFLSALYFSRYLLGLSQITIYACYGAFVILGLVVALLVAEPVAESSAEIVERLTSELEQAPFSKVLLGTLGLIVGLAVAFFISLAIQNLKFDSVPVIGAWLSPALILISAFAFGASGCFLGLRLAATRSLGSFLDNQGSVSALQILIDTSIIVDGRLAAVLDTGFVSGRLVVPQFVLGELQVLADAEDPLKRVRGRRGLELLENLRTTHPFEVLDDAVEGRGADQKLVKLSKSLKAALLTNDYNLQKVASVQGIQVLNLNQLASALKPSILPGEVMQLSLQREGKEHHQGVAYLEDGTMVVVERGRSYIGKDVIAEVTSIMQTATGKMVFAKFRHVVNATSAEQETA